MRSFVIIVWMARPQGGSLQTQCLRVHSIRLGTLPAEARRAVNTVVDHSDRNPCIRSSRVRSYRMLRSRVHRISPCTWSEDLHTPCHGCGRTLRRQPWAIDRVCTAHCWCFYLGRLANRRCVKSAPVHAAVAVTSRIGSQIWRATAYHGGHAVRRGGTCLPSCIICQHASSGSP